MPVIQTYCQNCHMKCPIHCTLEDGRLVAIRDNNCVKGRYAIEDVYSPTRVLHPLRRAGAKGEGKWRRISWAEAYDLMAENFGGIRDQYGPQTLCSITGCFHKETSAIASMMFAYLMGSPNLLDANLICTTPESLAQITTIGDMVTFDRGPDYAEAACIVVWGANPLNTRPPQGALIVARQKAGARLVVVDPRPTPLARRADLWLQPRPGTDAALALAIIRTMINEKLYDEEFVRRWCVGFEQLRQHVQEYTPERAADITWVPGEKIVAAARLIGTTKPVAIHTRLGTSAQVNSTQTGRAQTILTVLAGCLDVPGGNLLSNALGGFKVIYGLRNSFRVPEEVERLRIGADEFPLQCGTRQTARRRFSSHTTSAVQAMLDGGLRGMFILGNNLVCEEANSRMVRQALLNLEFFAVSELSLTPTAELADVVLPAAHWLETEGPTCGFTGRYNTVIGSTRVKAPEGECRDDREIILELARRMGLASPWQHVEDIHNLRLEETGLTWEDLKARPQRLVEYPVTFKKYEQTSFKTASGKIELFSSVFARHGYDPLPSFMEPPTSPVSTPHLFEDYPFILTQFRHLEFENTEYHQLPTPSKKRPHPCLEINPEAAARLGIANGEDVWIALPGREGRITAKARLAPEMHPRVVCLPHGWWAPLAPGPDHGALEHNLNAIASNGPPFDPINGQYHQRAILCAVGRVEVADHDRSEAGKRTARKARPARLPSQRRPPVGSTSPGLRDG